MGFLLWQGVSASARQHPERLAVQDADGSISYAQLERGSDQLATLLGSWGIGRGDRVAILMPKSVRSVITMVGTSKAGAAYVPVDPAAPVARSAFIIGNAAARVLVTNKRLLGALTELMPQLTSVQAILVADLDSADAPAAAVATHTWDAVTATEPRNANRATIEDDPAYILYTSGSTGTPKGVVISHRNALTFVEWGLDVYHPKAEDRFSNHAPLHFDLSVFDIYCALHSGASVHLVPDRLAPFPMELAKWIEEKRISIWYSVPSALIRMLQQGQLERFTYESLRVLNFAGEVFPVKHLRPVMERFSHASFYNLYGPTETNVCTFLEVPRPLPPEITDLSIGHSCANYDCFAVSEDGTRSKLGEEGELVVRGPGVALGYWGLPERTAQSFVQNPLHADFVDLAYRTGDIVTTATDGSFTFLGRRDHMVKTRGYRVELGEIEHVLHQHSAVNAAAVFSVPDEDIGARLWAAVVPEGSLTSEDLVGFCKTRLPHYAIPETFVLVPEMPRTSTGKVDRRALADSLVPTTRSTGTHA